LIPDLIVLHYTAMADTGAVIRHLCNKASQVSAHYVIDPLGDVTEMVPEALRAWHAGAASWGGEGDVNSRSIGIELVNDGLQPFSNPQMIALEGLLVALMARWDIAPSGVLAHSDVAPGRKIDPGARFDWRRLARQGLAVWPTPTAPGDFRADLARAGYTADVPDEVLLAAMRLRFRPWAHGVLDDADRAVAAGLAAQFPARQARRG
jgi:N-acetylmuramoyl-L-alanine amidase